MDFDADKLVPTYGFGAQVKMPNFYSEGKSLTIFPLNGDFSNPNYLQVDGVMKGYR